MTVPNNHGINFGENTMTMEAARNDRPSDRVSVSPSKHPTSTTRVPTRAPSMRDFRTNNPSMSPGTPSPIIKETTPNPSISPTMTTSFVFLNYIFLNKKTRFLDVF